MAWGKFYRSPFEDADFDAAVQVYGQPLVFAGLNGRKFYQEKEVAAKTEAPIEAGNGESVSEGQTQCQTDKHTFAPAAILQ